MPTVHSSVRKTCSICERKIEHSEKFLTFHNPIKTLRYETVTDLSPKKIMSFNGTYNIRHGHLQCVIQQMTTKMLDSSTIYD